MTQPRIENAPGLVWKPRKDGWEARWQCRTDLVKLGFEPKSQRLWQGTAPSPAEAAMIADACVRLQADMLVFGRGGVPQIGSGFDGTLRTLINCYQTDPDSTYHKLRYHSRRNHDTLLRRLAAMHGHENLADIKARVFLSWHKRWSNDGEKISVAHAFMGRLRTLFSFGATILEDRECDRLCGVLSKMRFPNTKPRDQRITADQAIAVRASAHEYGWHSIALAQAFQFELMLRQKDVVGEWVPLAEPGVSDVQTRGKKWLRGLRWSEIDDNLILRHVTSKRNKAIEVDLKLAQMVMEELAFIGERPKVGPIIICEATLLPYATGEFRRKWRMMADDAGIPKEVKNMDSRAGGITEATDAGADLEHVKHAATHSDISMTQNYSRGSIEKTAKVMQIRSDYRNKRGT